MLDGNDRKELSAIDARQEHMKKYGSFLYCEKRDTLCVHMDGNWMIGCGRTMCILDDPEYIALQKRIEENRIRASKRQEKKEQAAPIRNQKNMIRSHEQRLKDEIRRLEEESQEAFRDSRPADGETLFNRAQIMRGQLKDYMEGRKQ